MHDLFTDYGILQSGLALNPNGVGLSLSMCKQICQKLNGDIYCKSEKNKGSIFTFHVQATILPTAVTSIANSTSVTLTNFNIHHLVSEQDTIFKPSTINMPSMTNEVSFLFEKMCQVMLSDPKLLNSAALRDKFDRAVTIEMLETNILGGGGDFNITKGRVLIVDDQIFNIEFLKCQLEMIPELKSRCDYAENGVTAV